MVIAAEIIEAHGGSIGFARKIGKTAGAVRVWKHRNRIPRTAWPDIIAAFPEISLEILMITERARPSEGSAS